MTLTSKLVETNQRRLPVELDLRGRQQRVPEQENNQEDGLGGLSVSPGGRQWGLDAIGKWWL